MLEPQRHELRHAVARIPHGQEDARLRVAMKETRDELTNVVARESPYDLVVVDWGEISDKDACRSLGRHRGDLRDLGLQAEFDRIARALEGTVMASLVEIEHYVGRRSSRRRF